MVGLLSSIQSGREGDRQYARDLKKKACHISLKQGGVFYDLGPCFLSRLEENVAIHQANFVKSKRCRVAIECEIVSGPSLCIVMCCAILY